MTIVASTTALLDRLEAADAHLRCFITIDRIGAIAAAEAADARQQRGESLGPLDGVAVVVKDNLDTAGLRTTFGLGLFRERVPTADAEVVRRLRAAGTVIVAKANMTELACGTVGANVHFGDCRNPLDTDRYPGGSSSGSAAAVAAGLVRHAIGTDTGCSIRHPASACGVVGFKPTFGRTSNEGVSVCARGLDHVGPIAATVAGAADLLAAIQHDGLDDPRALVGTPVTGLRVARLTGEFLAQCRPDVLAAFEPAAALIGSLGATVGDLDLDHDLQAVDDVANVLGADLFDEYGDVLGRADRDAVGADLWAWYDQYQQIAPEAYAAAELEQQRITAEIHDRMRDWDLVISPTTRTGTGTFAEGAAEPRMMRMGNMSIWDLTGQPAITIPFGACANRMPLGLQIIGRRGDDARVLQLAAAVEAAID